MNLNLARKWRSRTFDEVVGQELPIRMLKNTLYLDHYFPVYLFSGQRGCGKTTAARIFAGAVNCTQLAAFQKDPKKNAIPCLQCNSCLAMKQGKHPDFVEIDAASHTGVDNVRQIIDAAALLPVLGRQKIYLIDEAHMLSKAAFNALLKILEEPPPSVFFILATTDPHKIIDTVISRCFQLFFRSVASTPLGKHLAFVCDKENIEYDQEGLRVIVAQTEGSVRDALNLLEQVRFSHAKVTKQAVLSVLGQLDDERLLAVFDAALNKTPAELLTVLQQIAIESFSARIIWDSLILLLRASLWINYGVSPQVPFAIDQLTKIVTGHNPELLSSYLQIFYDHEEIFLKTRVQHQVLEMVLLKIGMMRNLSMQLKKASNTHSEQVTPEQPKQNIPTATQTIANDPRWYTFIEKVMSLDDPLLLSIFKQGRFITCDEKTMAVTLAFPQNFTFFNEMIENTRNAWQAAFQELFGQQTKLIVQFDDAPKETVSMQTNVSAVTALPSPNSVPKPARPTYQKFNPVPAKRPVNRFKQVAEVKVNVSDKEKWVKAQLLLTTFSGTVVEARKDDYYA